MKIATWNVNSIKARLPHVLSWLQEQQPDVLALQETKTLDATFPLAALNEVGYQVVYTGQKAYNGVAVLSRDPATDVLTDLPGWHDPQRRLLAVTLSGVRVVNLYVPNGSEVGSDKYRYKLDWLEQVTTWLAAERAAYPRLVVLGDFNIAPEDRDVHDPEAWRGKVLFSEPEHAALQRLLDLGLTDVFRCFESAEGHFSWWDYRAAAFRRHRGLRIDLILASAALREHGTACYIDKTPRGWERPSDHAPVVAEFSV
jgi:exodeoxyribonuclease-3